MAVTVMRASRLDDWRRIIDEHCYVSDTQLLSSWGGDFSLTTVEAGMLDVEQYCGPDSATRRTWHHIREKSRDAYLLWFPLNGHVIITQDQQHESVIESGDFFVTCGNRPLYARSFSGSNEPCSQMFIWVPSHIMRSCIPKIDHLCGRKFSGQKGPGRIGAHLFHQLLAQADYCSADSLSGLGEAALNAVRDSIRVNDPTSNVSTVHHSASSERVMRFIDQHFTRQGLTAEEVARACNLSIRSLHYLLRSKRTTFTTYLRTERLRQAREWLNDPEFLHFNIVDIAYMVGFQSASHFSNAYRSHFGIAPRELRRSTAFSAGNAQDVA